MGGREKGGNIEQFKLNFVAENGVIPYYAIKKIHNQTIYDTMVQKAGAIINPVFSHYTEDDYEDIYVK